MSDVGDAVPPKLDGSAALTTMPSRRLSPDLPVEVAQLPIDLTAHGVTHVLRVGPRNLSRVPFETHDAVAIVRAGLGRLEDEHGHLRAYRGPGSIVYAEDLMVGAAPTVTFNALTTEVELVTIPATTFAHWLVAHPALKTHVFRQLMRDRHQQRRFDLSRRWVSAIFVSESGLRWKGVVASYLLEALDALGSDDEPDAGDAPYEALRRRSAPPYWLALPLARISGDLAVSEAPVREGLRLLEGSRLITRRGGLLKVTTLSGLIDAVQSPAGGIPGLTV